MSFFDAQHPPSHELIDDCVHCGFCLPTCPTYVLWGEEMDSPRGRIHLMNRVADRQALLDSTVGDHFDACLGCMACVTACPSGVQYDRLMEATRAQVERRRAAVVEGPRLPPADLLAVPVPGPAARRCCSRRALPAPAGWTARLRRRPACSTGLRPALRLAGGLLPRSGCGTSAPRTVGGARQRAPAAPGRHADRLRAAGVLPGRSTTATLRVLAAEGCDVALPAGRDAAARCRCHSGREAEAAGFARRLIDAFERADIDTIVVNARAADRP